MKAMVLAAGFGKRMLPLTATTPKPLLKAGGKALIEWTLLSLAKAGVTDVVVNHAWLGEQIVEYLGDGSRLGVRIHYSREAEPLETAGGIAKALDLFGAEPFIVVNADVYSTYDFSSLADLSLAEGVLAHLVMVDNPAHNQAGDFSISDSGLLQKKMAQTYTFSGISVLTPALFRHYQCFEGPLLPLLLKALAGERVTAEYFSGFWADIGTPERLLSLNQVLNPV